MKSFEMGIGYLRQEALKSGFLAESDNDNKLIERLSQVIRKLGPEDAEKCDEFTKEAQGGGEESVEPEDKEKEVEPSTDKGPEREA